MLYERKKSVLKKEKKTERRKRDNVSKNLNQFITNLKINKYRNRP